MRWGMRLNKSKPVVDKSKWHPWFAWYPVKCLDQYPNWQYLKYVWLETVYTRKTGWHNTNFSKHAQSWQYSFLPGPNIYE